MVEKAVFTVVTLFHYHETNGKYLTQIVDLNVNYELMLIIMYQYSSAVLNVPYQCKILITEETLKDGVVVVRRHREILSISFSIFL